LLQHLLPGVGLIPAASAKRRFYSTLQTRNSGLVKCGENRLPGQAWKWSSSKRLLCSRFINPVAPFGRPKSYCYAKPPASRKMRFVRRLHSNRGPEWRSRGGIPPPTSGGGHRILSDGK
jgi:hypothetical protein